MSFFCHLSQFQNGAFLPVLFVTQKFKSSRYLNVFLVVKILGFLESEQNFKPSHFTFIMNFIMLQGHNLRVR